MSRSFAVLVLVSCLVAGVALLWPRAGSVDAETNGSSEQAPAVSPGSSNAASPSAIAPFAPPPILAAPSPYIQQVYGASTLVAQQRLAQAVVGDARFDAEMMNHHGERLCNYLAGNPATGLAAAAVSSKALPKDAAALKSYRMVDEFRASYCGSVLDANSAEPSNATAVSLIAASEHGSDHAETLLRAMTALEESMSEDTAAELRESLMAVVRSTESPAMLLEAGVLLTTPEYAGFSPPGYDPAGLDEQQALLVSQFGMQLAACEVFNFCQQRNGIAIRMCMPSNCRGNGTVQEYVRGSLSPVEHEAARRYANALLDFRR